jgi:hypothetical protein
VSSRPLPCLKHKHSQHDPEHKHDQEYGQRNVEKNLGNSPGTFGDAGKAEEPSNERDNEKEMAHLIMTVSLKQMMILLRLKWVLAPFLDARKLPGFALGNLRISPADCSARRR